MTLKNRRLIVVLVLVLLIGGAVILMILRGGEGDRQRPTIEPAAGFVPRHSREEVERGIAEARSEREKLNSLPANGVTNAEAAQALAMKRKAEAMQTPAGAEAEARRQLVEIDRRLALASDPKEREQLERQKRLVEEVLAKLGKM